MGSKRKADDIEMSLDLMDEYCHDSDVCSPPEIDDLFKKIYTQFKELRIAENNSNKFGCTQMSLNPSQSSVVIGNNSGEIHMMDLESCRSINTLQNHDKEITGLKYEGDHLIFSCSQDKTVKCYDTRTDKSVTQYKGDANVKPNPYTCLDINASGSHVAAGTTLNKDKDAFINFWDLRKPEKIIGSYFESHSDEITTIKFHPTKKNCLSSGAMDNLVNIYDISKSSEDDALAECINLETTPDSIHWDPHAEHSSKLFVLNFPQTIQYWDVSDSNPAANLTAKTFCEAIRRKIPSQCNYISCGFDKKSNPIIMGSSNLELDNRHNACVRVVKFDRESNKLKPHSQLENAGNLSHIIDSIYLTKFNTFVTLNSSAIQIWKKLVKNDDDSRKKIKKMKLN